MKYHGEYLPESYYEGEVCEADGCDETKGLRWDDEDRLVCGYHYEINGLMVSEEVQDVAA